MAWPKTRNIKTVFYYAALLLFLTSVVALVGFQWKPEGWILFCSSVLFALFLPGKASRYFVLLHLAALFVCIAEINTKVDYRHLIVTTLLLGASVFIPYVVSNYAYRDRKISVELGSFRKWSKKQYGYLFFAAAGSYIVLPFYLHNTGAYVNWPSENDTGSLLRLFLGTNGLGIWDELFFVVVILGTLKHLFSFFWANVSQAILWTVFLHELGFIGWAPPMVFAFAMLQGYVYRKTHSLLYILSIHLTVDLMLYLALVNAHHPEMFNIFIT